MFGQTAIFNGLLTGRISKFLTEAVLHIPGMYQKSAVEGPVDVHTSPKKPISAIFRGVCTSVPHCRALSVYIPGMYKQHSVRASLRTEAKAPSLAGTYRVCTKNLPQRGPQMHIPPPKSRFWPIFEGYVHAYSIARHFPCTYPVCAAAQRTCIPAHQGKSPLVGRHISGMYQKSAVEGPVDVHTSPKKPISAIFRGVCTSVPHCRALSVHISGMCSSTAYVHPRAPRQKPPRRQVHTRYVQQHSEAKGTGASKSKKIVIFVRRT